MQIILMQDILIGCLFSYLIESFANTSIKLDNSGDKNDTFQFHLAKIGTLILTHLIIFKGCKKGLKLMDFVLNNWDSFDWPIMAIIVPIY